MPRLLLILLSAATGHFVTAQAVSPLQKVLQLLDSLEAKIHQQGEAEDKAYEEFTDWCREAAQDAGFALKTATMEKEDLTAQIASNVASAEAAITGIEETAKAIASSEADLKAAASIREKEKSEFLAAELELMDAIDTLSRAVTVIEREMRKNPAFLQNNLNTGNLDALMKSLNAVIDATSLNGRDKQKLMTLVQRSSEQDDDEDEPAGAPSAEAYKSHSSNIVDVLDDMKEKAESQLADARKAEVNSQHNFELLRQSLEDQNAANTKEMNQHKSAKAAALEAKAVAEKGLDRAVKDLANARATLQTSRSSCQTAAGDHEASVKSRQEELKAVAEAKDILSTGTSGAEDQAYSLLQHSGARNVVSAGDGTLAAVRTRSDLVNLEVVTMIKQLAKEHHSSTLAQLAQQVSAVVRYGGAAGDDPFQKVRDLIQGLIARLEEEAGKEASRKAYCDGEMQKSSDRQVELSGRIEKMSAKLDSAATGSTRLKEEVAAAQKELADIAKAQVDMDKARSAESEAFVKAKAELEQGISAVQQALSVLRDYYGSQGEALLQQSRASQRRQDPVALPDTHQASSGAGGGIISMLEVVASDFSKHLAAIEVEEDGAATEYQKVSQQNAISKTMLEQDVTYKVKEFKSLDKKVAELSSDRASERTELDAVMTYEAKLAQECVAKPETYEVRKQRREAEIQGLQEALRILEGEAVLVQSRAAGHRSRRGLRLGL
jgi:chromosome segregation ATPase